MAWLPLVTADVWKTAPFVALLLLAGLQNIDDTLYEAARMDGAGWLEELWEITLPLLKPALRRLYPDSFEIVDSAQTTAAKVEKLLDHARMRAVGGRPTQEILCTGRADTLREVSAILFGEAVDDVREINLWD